MSRHSFGIIGLFCLALTSCQFLTREQSRTADKKEKITIALDYVGSLEFTTPAVFEFGFVSAGLPLDVGTHSHAPITRFLVSKLPQTVELDENVLPQINQDEFFVGYYVTQIAKGDGNMFSPSLTSIVSSFSIDDFHSVRILLAHDLGSGYVKSGSEVFYAGKKLEGCDPLTFEIMDARSKFSRDATHVYADSNLLPEADPKSFVLLEGSYARDAKSVFYFSQKLPVNDPSKFVVFIDSRFAKDDASVFFNGSILDGAHAPSFVSLSGGYAKDDTRVYNLQYVMEGINPATFRSVGAMAPFPNFYATDGNQVYYKSQPINTGNASGFLTFDFDFKLRSVPPEYATDGTSLYYSGIKVENIDLPSFEVVISVDGIVMGRDKNNYYLGRMVGLKADYDMLSQIAEKAR